MNARTALTACAFIACVGSVWAVLTQRQQLATLRSERQGSAREINPAAVAEMQNPSAIQAGAPVSEQLLQLRNEVTRLSARKRGLAAVAEENERLKSQLESSSTNAQGGNQLPPGYIRKAQARFAGYSTPENTFQSFLWALRNHETRALMQSLTPAAAQRLQARLEDPSQAAEFFKNLDALPGLAIQNRKDKQDGWVQFEIEVVPGMPKETMSLQSIGGEWKLDMPF